MSEDSGYCLRCGNSKTSAQFYSCDHGQHEKEIDFLRQRLKELEEINRELIEFSVHQETCAIEPWEAGEPTPDGGYRTKIRGKWYQSKPIDETPKCDCGLESLVSKAKEMGI